MIAIILSTTGCAQLCARYQKAPEYVYIQQPIPAPPVVERPHLKILEITASTSDGDVVVFYRTAVEQLINYAKQLENVVRKYDELSKDTKEAPQQ